MSLTAHYDASDTDELFTTYDAGGVHTGTPSDGNPVEVWDEDSGISDQALVFPGTNAQAPNFRSGGSALMKAGLTELDFNGTEDRFQFFNQTGDTGKLSSAYLTVSAKTFIAAIYPDAIDSTAANPWERDCLIADSNDLWGVFLWNDSGTRRVSHYGFDGSDHVQNLAITVGAVSIIVARHEGGNLKLSIIDASGTQTDAGDVACGDTNGLDRFHLGNNEFAFYDGRIGEFKIWNTGNADGGLTTEIDAFKEKWLDLGDGGGFLLVNN